MSWRTTSEPIPPAWTPLHLQHRVGGGAGGADAGGWDAEAGQALQALQACGVRYVRCAGVHERVCVCVWWGGARVNGRVGMYMGVCVVFL
jgi:hypothetical protein